MTPAATPGDPTAILQPEPTENPIMDMFFTRPATILEWGYRYDCAKQDCNPVHPYNGQVKPVYTSVGVRWRSTRRPPDRTIDGHATTVVKHTVTVTDWTAA